MPMSLQEQESAEVVIVRDSQKDIMMRGLEIFVDGEFTHDLGYNKTFKLKLPIGAHQIKVSNHLYTKSLDIDLKVGETLNLQAGNCFTLIGGLMVSVLGMGPYKVFLHPVSSTPLSDCN